MKQPNKFDYLKNIDWSKIGTHDHIELVVGALTNPDITRKTLEPDGSYTFTGEQFTTSGNIYVYDDLVKNMRFIEATTAPQTINASSFKAVDGSVMPAGYAQYLTKTRPDLIDIMGVERLSLDERIRWCIDHNEKLSPTAMAKMISQLKLRNDVNKIYVDTEAHRIYSSQHDMLVCSDGDAFGQIISTTKLSPETYHFSEFSPITFDDECECIFFYNDMKRKYLLFDNGIYVLYDTSIIITYVPMELLRKQSISIDQSPKKGNMKHTTSVEGEYFKISSSR